MLASYYGHYEVAKVLLKNGAKPDLLNNVSLWLACSQQRCDIAELLLKSGAQVDSRDATTGASALMLACNYGFRDIVESSS